MGSPHVYTVKGIVLKRRNFGEADRTITLFTQEFGKIRVLAKGIRKINSRRSGHLEVFRYVHLTLARGKTFEIVSEAQTIHIYEDLERDLSKVSFAYYLCELTDVLLPDSEPNQEVLMLLDRHLRGLSVSSDEAVREGLVLGFAVSLLHTLGFLPPSKSLSLQTLIPFVETIIEKKLRSPTLHKKLNTPA